MSTLRQAQGNVMKAQRAEKLDSGEHPVRSDMHLAFCEMEATRRRSG